LNRSVTIKLFYFNDANLNEADLMSRVIYSRSCLLWSL